MNDDKHGANDRGLNKYNIRRKDELVKENERLREENKKLMDGMESAWGLIANAQSVAGDGKVEHWQASMERWRDNDWHPALDRNEDLLQSKGGG